MESKYKQKQKKIRRKIKDWDHLAKEIVGKDAPRKSFGGERTTILMVTEV